jgi:hypothetical protein
LIADVEARCERAVINRRAGACVDEREAGRRGNRHLAHVAEKISDHRFFRERRHVAFLVHVDRRAVTLRVDERAELRAARPERRVGIRDGDRLAVVDFRGEREVEAVLDAQIVNEQRRVEDAALEADRLHRHRLAIDGHGELRGGGRGDRAVGVDEIPIVERAGAGLL